MFRLDDYRLSRSGDAGQTWNPIDIWGDQLVSQVAFAPVAGPDRPIFATVISFDFPSYGDRRPRPTTDHIRSVGIAVSRDGGESWQTAASQPELEGIPFRQVLDLVISPTFEQDHSIAVFAWGPSEPTVAGPSNRPVRPAAAFLSIDEGASWSSIWRPMGSLSLGPPITNPSASPLWGHVAFSRTFAQDDRLILNLGGGISPGSSFCNVLHTGNSGQTWNQLVFQQGYNSGSTCLGLPGGMAGRAFTALSEPGIDRILGPVFVDSDGRVQGLPWLASPTPGPNAR